MFDLEKKGKKYEEAVKIVKSATYQTKVILDTLHEEHFLY